MIYDVDINKILVSNEIYFGKNGFKYSTGYKDGKKVKPLFVMLPKTSMYRTDFDETKYMFFFIKNDELIEKYNEIWDKVSNAINKRFDREPV